MSGMERSLDDLEASTVFSRRENRSLERSLSGIVFVLDEAFLGLAALSVVSSGERASGEALGDTSFGFEALSEVSGDEEAGGLAGCDPGDSG